VDIQNLGRRLVSEQAIACGVFGVPAIQADDQIFWGFDSLPILRQYLEGDAWFKTPAWTDAAKLPVGIVRKR